METGTIRAFLLTGLIITAMILGVLFAPKSHATTEQDYQYFSLLENNGMHIKATYHGRCWLRQVHTGAQDLPTVEF